MNPGPCLPLPSKAELRPLQRKGAALTLCWERATRGPQSPPLSLSTSPCSGPRRIDRLINPVLSQPLLRPDTLQPLPSTLPATTWRTYHLPLPRGPPPTSPRVRDSLSSGKSNTAPQYVGKSPIYKSDIFQIKQHENVTDKRPARY